MKDNSRLTYLLNRHMEKAATPDERDELMRLVASGDYNEIVKDYIEAGLSGESDGEEMSMERARAILSKIMHKKKEGRVVQFTHWSRVAAAIAILMITGLAVYIFRYTEATVHLVATTPGSEKVILELAEGTLIELDSARTITIPQPGGTVITNTNGQLTYSQRNFDSEVIQFNKIVTPKAGRYKVELSDGTKIWLNEGSTLKYPTAFDGEMRKVELIGEAYFDVAHDPSKPFVVSTGKIMTKVLGTAFNIKAYDVGTKVIVTVARGKVAVGDETRSFDTIVPDEQITVNVKDNDFVKSRIDAQLAYAWKENHFVLNNVTFEEAASLLEARFNVKVTIKNESLRECRVVASFQEGADLVQVVKNIAGTRQAQVVINGKNVIIEGGTGCGGK